ncbi:ABC transporter substrate-binding protein [Diplocloster hominis]|uniref:ABC transporter substrate-binding protein n=1 Tax=Diplocloster hominis TaxID=3079010 RepID=UPI0031BA012F
MKKVLAMILCISIIGTFVGGCSPSDNTNADSSTNVEQSGEQSETELQKVRIGVMPFMVSMPVDYIIEKGWDKEAGLDIELVKFATGAPMNEALGAGEWDMAAIGMAMIFSMANYEGKLVAETTDATGGLNAYIRSDSEIAKVKGYNPTYPDLYGDPDSLRGATFLLPTGTSAQLNAIKWVEKLGLKETDINIVNMEYGQAYQAFLTGQGDVLCAAPPYNFQCEEQGWLVGASMKDLGVQVYDGVIAADQFYEEHPDLVQKFVTLMYRAGKDFKDEDTAVRELMKFYKNNGKESAESDVRNEVRLRPYFTADELLNNPNYKFGAGSVEIAEFYTGTGQLENEKVSIVESCLIDKFLKQANEDLR